MTWDEFESSCPELAQIARKRLPEDELVVMGTPRKDGAPRISPVEPTSSPAS
jgi:hypothetical protein